jgi:two-component system sensor histidine kinase QseC
MSLPRPASLQARLIAVVLGLVALVGAVAGVTTWLDARHELDELLDGHLAQAAALLVVHQAGDLDDAPGLDAPTLHRYAPRVAFQVFRDGRLQLKSAQAPAQPMAAIGPGDGGFSTVDVDGARWRVFSAHAAQDEAHEDVQVIVGERIDARDSILRAVLRGSLTPLLVALPLLALAVGAAIHRTLRPLRRLGDTLARRPADALGPVDAPDAPSEMKPLVAALDGLLARIGTLLDAERRFTADAAHELRTPIAAIRTQAQVALNEADDAARRHALTSTIAGCDRATRLVAQLLTLARLEAGDAAARHAIDLAPVARGVVAELAPAALARGQTLDFAADDGCRVAGDATLLEVLVRNLVDNAVRYGGPAVPIEVRVRRDGAQVIVTVEDGGAGLADADLARYGERFFRVTGQDAPGSGLGGSIARRIAAAHGARLAAGRSPRLGGLAVSVAFHAVDPGA